MQRKTETIGFRADTELLRLIDNARQPFAISRGDWARSVVITHLHDADRQSLLTLVGELRDQLTQLNERLVQSERNLARVAYLLLTEVGDLPNEQAKELVRSRLKV